MRLEIDKNNKHYTPFIYLHNVLIWVSQVEHRTKESAALELWETALLIKDVAVATEQSVESLCLKEVV